MSKVKNEHWNDVNPLRFTTVLFLYFLKTRDFLMFSWGMERHLWLKRVNEYQWFLKTMPNIYDVTLQWK